MSAMPPCPGIPAQESDPTDESLASQSIVWIDRRAIERPWRMTKAAMISFAISVIGTFGFFVTQFFFPSWTALLGEALGAMLIVTAVLAVMALVHRELWSASVAKTQRRAEAPFDRTPDRVVQRLLMDNAGPACPRAWGHPGGPDGSDFQDRLVDEGLPVALTIVDATFKDDIEKIDITDNLLEPEPIDSRPSPSSLRNWWSVFALGVGTVLWISIAFNNGELVNIAIACFLACWWLLLVLRMLGLRALESTSPVAGLGYVESPTRRKRWTVSDSCLVVTRKTPISHLLVEFVGPSGHIAMSFGNTNDEGFIALWQRWRHPHPRIELADEL